ncbi:hypothetical protein M0R45_027618 [Rubus argutus]|uniref:FLZ-type domain-containing protein n=1 Tax=Rubus argutus TaxID=59490 RepID=A0AAW1X3L2_RUBAR
MLLGKRPRPPMKRTTSIWGPHHHPHPPRNLRRNSADFVETPHFLRACGLCKRRLVPGRDIYMYRKVFISASTAVAGHQVSAKGETVAAL